MIADGFRRELKWHLRRFRGAVLTVRAENATKKVLHDTRKEPLVLCPSPSYAAEAFPLKGDSLPLSALLPLREMRRAGTPKGGPEGRG